MEEAKVHTTGVYEHETLNDGARVSRCQGLAMEEGLAAET